MTNRKTEISLPETKAEMLLGPAVSFQNCFLSFQTLQINGLFKAGWTAQPLWGIYFKAVLFFILRHDNKEDKEPAEEPKQRVDSAAWQSSQVEHINDVKEKKKEKKKEQLEDIQCSALLYSGALTTAACCSFMVMLTNC